MKKIAAFSLLFMASLAGCALDKQSDAELKAQLDNATSIQMLKLRVDGLESETQLMKEQVAQQAAQTDFDTASYALVEQPNDSRWVLGRTQFGKFAVSVESIEAKGAGSVVILNVMNFAAAGISRAQFDLYYSQYTVKDRVALINAGKDSPPVLDPVSFQSDKTFPPGVWVRQEIVLPELPPEKIRFLSVKFDGTAIAGARQL